MTPSPKLTNRQIQLLNLFSVGKSNASIAEVMQISEHTVKVHIWRLFSRIEVTSRLEAAAWWRAQQAQTVNAEMDNLVKATGQFIRAAKSEPLAALAQSLAELEDAYEQVIA